MGTLTIRLDDQLEADLERIAASRHTSKSEVVRDMLRRYTSVELFEHARRELQPRAAEQGFLTDEDFFREFS